MAGGHGGTNRIWTILKVVFVVFIIALILFWIVTGGPQRAWEAGKNFTNPIAYIFGDGTTTGPHITLPWQPEATRGPDISDYVQAADEQQSDADSSGQNSDTSTDISQLQQFGNPSPYQGEVTISGNNENANPAQEYIEIQASGVATPVEITGWTLQSAVSGKEGFLPQGAIVFRGGAVNTLQPVYLSPGSSAIVTTGASPVGISFEQNICSGYLGELQSFYPALDSSCPSPSEALPQTAQNLKTYGASCFDYVNDLESCEFPGANLPSNLSAACRSFLSTTLSYNGCVAMHQAENDFELPSWRLYLAMPSALWNTSHDIIRLLDNDGRVVDVLQY